MQTGRAHRNLAWLLALAAARLMLHLLGNDGYGWHRDELGLRDDALDLDWGYVNYPPLAPWLARVAMELGGDSLVAFRMPAAIAQCAAMVLAGLMARELGGGRAAQLLAALAMAAAPFSLLAGSLMQYVSLDLLWWVLVGWLALRLNNRASPRLWLAMGLAIGLGMLTRFTLLFCVAGLLAAVVAAPALRRQLATPWPWAGAALALLLFLPHALWQVQHGFVYLEFVQHLRLRDAALGRTGDFWPQQFLVNASPLLAPLWLAGLGGLLFARQLARHRTLAALYLVPALLFWLAGGRAYYLAPAYPLLFAAGAVVVATWLGWGAGAPQDLRAAGRVRVAARAAVVLVMALALASSAVLSLPLAPVGSWGWRASSAVHDNFREQMGWPAFVAQLAAVYHALPEHERRGARVLAANYGQAGAIRLYGPAHGLPPAISGTNTHWYRGYGDPPPTVLIVPGADPDDMAAAPADCSHVATFRNPLGVNNEEARDPLVYVCRNLQLSWESIWPRLRSFG